MAAVRIQLVKSVIPKVELFEFVMHILASFAVDMLVTDILALCFYFN